MPRAGRPLNRLVSAVWLATSLCSAARCTALVVASSHSRKAVPSCTALAPRRSASSTPAASAMPPAAITGTRTASRRDVSNERMRSCDARSNDAPADRNTPRWPPASRPWAMIASTPCAASHCASATVVADDHTCAPERRTRSSSGAGGSPKWKLTTAGRSASIASAASSPNGSRPGPLAIAENDRPSSS